MPPPQENVTITKGQRSRMHSIGWDDASRSVVFFLTGIRETRQLVFMHLARIDLSFISMVILSVVKTSVDLVAIENPPKHEGNTQIHSAGQSNFDAFAVLLTLKVDVRVAAGLTLQFSWVRRPRPRPLRRRTPPWRQPSPPPCPSHWFSATPNKGCPFPKRPPAALTPSTAW